MQRPLPLRPVAVSAHLCTPPSQWPSRVVVRWSLAGLLDLRGRPSSAGAVLRLVTCKISHPFPGLSPLGFRPRYCCLPHSPNEVLGFGLLATNFKPMLTSPYAGSLKNLQSIVQRRTATNRGLTLCNAKQPMQKTQWCSRRATACNALGTLALNHIILHSGTNDHMH